MKRIQEEKQMTSKQLGRLEQIRNIRKYWEREATDFTPWLSEGENLKLLGDTIGIELGLEAQEKNVGPFRADILCKDTANNQWVLIENQIEKTDHTHLGQLITYAAGLHAVTIVWISAKFTEQHRSAVDWLNEITNESFSFFGLEIELWKVDDSLPAPKFNIISKPNDWSKSVSNPKIIGSVQISETQHKQLLFWQQFREYLLDSGCSVKPTKAFPQHWMNISIGKSGFNLAATLNSVEKKIGVELYIGNDFEKKFFNELEKYKKTITSSIGKATWLPLKGKKASRIICYKNNTDPLDESQWAEQNKWIVTKLDEFDNCFRPLLSQLF